MKTETAVLIRCLWYSLHLCQFEGTNPLQLKANDGNIEYTHKQENL